MKQTPEVKALIEAAQEMLVWMEHYGDATGEPQYQELKSALEAVKKESNEN